MDTKCVLNRATNDASTEEDACELDDSTTRMKTKIQCPAVKDRYRLCDVDISLSFYAFQTVALSNQDELNKEEHVQSML